MAEEKYHSLVYRDTDMQKYLKDILIPLIGYRDVGHTLGSFRDSIDKLKVEVKALQIPPKTKFYQHHWNLPIVIKIPDKSYEYPDVESFEPIKVTVEFDRVINDTAAPENNGRWSYMFEIMIPGGGIKEVMSSPYCVACNTGAYQEIKEVRVKRMEDLRQEISQVFVVDIPFIKNNSGENISYEGGSVTVYSENRNVEVTSTWDNLEINDPGITTNYEWNVTMGSIPYFDPVEDVDKLVYSEEIRWINALTLPALEYLQETGNTDPDTLYVGREDDDETYDGTIHFETLEDFQRELPVLYKIFGYNWRYLDIEFGDDVISIDGMLEGNKEVTGAPRRIIGASIESAKNIFKDSAIQYVDNQETLFEGIPNVKWLDNAFENSAVNIDLEDIMISQLENLLSVRGMFANTHLGDSETPWLIFEGGLDGRGFFDGTTFDNSAALDGCPTYWRRKTGTTLPIYTRYAFDRIRDEILRDKKGELTGMTIQFLSDSIPLDGLFESSSIKTAPSLIIAPKTTSMKRGFANCGELTSVPSTLFGRLETLERFDEMFLNNISLVELPTTMDLPKTITSYNSAFKGLPLVTGQAPTNSNGTNLWELAGRDGYPAEIDGTNCFANSLFANITEIPKSWGGELDV